MAKIYLVRHGITESNTSMRFSGQTDVALSEEGRRQAEKLRDRLAGEKIDFVYSSDLQRARTTAGIITSCHDVEMEVCPDIRELNYGEAEGLTYQEIRERFPELSEMIAKYSPVLCFPGGEGFAQLAERADRFITRLETHGKDDTVLVVSHGGMMRTLVCRLLDMEHEHWPKFRFDNASLTIIDIYPARSILSLLNDTSHLK